MKPKLLAILYWLVPPLRRLRDRALAAEDECLSLRVRIAELDAEAEQFRKDNAALRSEVADMKAHPALKYVFVAPHSTSARGAHSQRGGNSVAGGY